MNSKQMIEIDVSEGYEIDLISKSELNPGREIPHFDITVYLKKKEPEFIEVRDYSINFDGYPLPQVITKKQYMGTDVKPEYLSDFIKWDGDWRKVEI